MPLLNPRRSGQEPDGWRLVPAVAEGAGYRLLRTSEYDAVDETWAFAPGSLVTCEEREVGFGRMLVAVGMIR